MTRRPLLPLLSLMALAAGWSAAQAQELPPGADDLADALAAVPEPRVGQRELGRPGAGLGIPYHDVDRLCATINDAYQVSECVRREQLSYNLVKYAWGSLSDRAKAYALEQAGTPNRNYSYYETLEITVGAALQIDREQRARQGAIPRFQR